MFDAVEFENAALRLAGLRRESLRVVAGWLDVDLPEASDAERVMVAKARALPPPSCGPVIPLAPARGRVVAITPMGMRATSDGFEAVSTGYLGRDAARAADVFDEMARQARRKGGVDPFTERQKATARTYAALVERHSAIGVKGRSIETMMGGGSSGRSDGIMDLIIDEGMTIQRMQAAIGDGWALEVSRQGKRKRTPLMTRDLVDMVCLSGRSISEILDGYGWAVYGETRDWARAALASALDRMASCTKGIDA